MSINPLPSLRRLVEAIDYNPTTGEFYWKVRNSNRVEIGDPCGTISNGYLAIGLDGVTYRAHRIAWKLFYKRNPPEQIDHIDGNRLNNKISNLRKADFHLNAQNQRKARRNNTHGHFGVSYCKQTKLWRAQLMNGRQRHHLGRYQTPEEAHLAYLEAKRKLHKGNTL